MKNPISKILLSSIAMLSFTSPSFGTEVFNIKYGEQVPSGLENEILVFDRGPKGETNSAETELLKKRKLEESKPSFKAGDIKCTRRTAISGLPGRTLWTYKITGLESAPNERVVRLSFEGNPPELKLAIPSSCQVKGNLQADYFDPEKVKGLPEADTLCKLVTSENSNVYFESIIPAGMDSVVISVVATSKESSPLIKMKAEVQGYKAISVLMPGPDIGV